MADATRHQATAHSDPGSFRDWDGRVFSHGDRVLRALSADGLESWRALAASATYGRFSEGGELVETRPADDEELSAVLEADPGAGWVAALSHERVPFVSYPYEWTFSMLKDAALLQLRLTSSALADGLALKDASPYNVQWRGVDPVFIDVGSFERARAGEPWAGYRQFCTLFLYPLLLEAHLGVPFQPWLRGSVDGITPREARSLFRGRDAFRRGVWRHVFLHASLERRYERTTGSGVSEELASAGFDSQIVEANVRSMAKLVDGLGSRVGESSWETYHASCSYDDADSAAKTGFVSAALAESPRREVWDLGCNDGRHSELAAAHSRLVVAMDSDPVVVDSLYRRLRAEQIPSIVPLVMDLVNPSPGLGWRNTERAGLAARGEPDFMLCLALVHHLSIGHNVPLREVVDWLRSRDAELVVEFPHREDPMVQRLLQRKRSEAHPDYRRETFEACLHDRFRVVRSLELPGGTRTLYYGRPE